jgi:selenide,water dikinase
MGILPAGMYRNRRYAQSEVDDRGDQATADQRATLRSQSQQERSPEWMQTMQDLLYDPQTSGGLLMAVDPEDAPQMLRDLQEAEKQPGNEGMQCAVIGHVQAFEGGKRIQLV